MEWSQADWLLIDTVIRAAAAMNAALLGVAIWRDGENRLSARLVSLLCLSIIAHLLVVSPVFPGAEFQYDLPAEILSMGIPAFFWLVALAIFVDDYRLGRLHVLLASTYVLYSGLHAGYLYYSEWNFPASVLLRIGMFGFTLAALIVAWRGRADDLVEERIRLRNLLVWSIGILALVVPIFEILQYLGRLPDETVTFSALLILIFSCVNVWFLMGMRDSQLLYRRSAAGGADTVEPADPDEPRILAALERLMREERLYRQDGLGIAAVADRVGVPEYRLRRVINRRLGHRNFAAYLNGYRLEDVRGALGDPAQADVPILTIALDAGFGSLAPFNRAFRQAENMTPTAYRKKALSGE